MCTFVAGEVDPGCTMCGFRSCPNLPYERSLEIPRGKGVLTFSLPESVMETFKVLLPFEDLWMKSYGMTIHMKHFPL